MPSANRTLLVDACAVGCPLILVLAVRTLFAPAPSDASPVGATVGPTPPVIVSVAASTKLSPEQQKAADWIASLAPMKDLTSPLDHPVPLARPEPKVAVSRAEPAPTSDPLSGLRVTSIMGNNAGNMAAISGRIYKVGDEVRQGLKVKAIDVATNSVTFAQADGTELQLKRTKK